MLLHTGLSSGLELELLLICELDDFDLLLCSLFLTWSSSLSLVLRSLLTILLTAAPSIDDDYLVTRAGLAGVGLFLPELLLRGALGGENFFSSLSLLSIFSHVCIGSLNPAEVLFDVSPCSPLRILEICASSTDLRYYRATLSNVSVGVSASVTCSLMEKPMADLGIGLTRADLTPSLCIPMGD